ncbi:hypothetical protein Ancab_015892 [Ancistrocladus abbreviatus]
MPGGGGGSGGAAREAWKAHGALALAQTMSAGYIVFSKVALNGGVNKIVSGVFRAVVALSPLAPLAYIRENTETVNLFRIEGQMKVAGTLTCVSGAILMAIFRGPAILGCKESGLTLHDELSALGQPEAPEPVEWFTARLVDFGLEERHLSVLCLLGNCLCLATYLALQAPILKKYPATLSVTAFSYFFGTLPMLMVALFVADNSTDWTLTPSEWVAVFYGGVVASALVYGLLTWSNKILGPALVSLYYPLQPLGSALLSFVFLGNTIFLGSVLGGFLIITGLYLVSWASYREKQAVVEVITLSEPLIPENALLIKNPP